MSATSGIHAAQSARATRTTEQPVPREPLPRDEFVRSGASSAPKEPVPGPTELLAPVAPNAARGPRPSRPVDGPSLGAPAARENAPVRLAMDIPPVRVDAPPPVPKATRALVRETVGEVLQDVASRYPAEFIGVGSHVTGANYRDPLAELDRVRKAGLPLSEMHPSDHDYRLLLPGSTSLDQVESRYREVRETLADSLQNSLRKRGCDEEQIRAVLANVNLYPPDEVLVAVTTDAEANAFFKSRGLTPNLGGRDVDGLWGDGARTWVNHYEEKSGQRIFLEGRKVCVGRTDLTHLVEQGGYGKLTAEGSANLAAQFAEKGLAALDEGKPLDLVKDLKRLDKALARSRSLAMAPASNEGISGLLSIIQDVIDSNTGADGQLSLEGRKVLEALISERGDVLRRELKLARAEAAVLQTLHKAEGGASKVFYRQLLERSTWGPWGNALHHFWEQAERVDPGELVDFAFRYGTMVDLVVQQFNATGDRNLAYEQTMRLMEAMGGVGVGLTVALVDVILESAKASGIRMAARAQDGENLIGGIYSAWGAQDVRDGPLVRTVNQIASEFPDTSDGRQGLENLVRLHSRRLAEGHPNPDPAFRQELEEEVFGKCLPEVMTAWRGVRLEKIHEINRLLSGLRSRMETGEARLWLEDGTDGNLEVPPESEPPLGVKARVRGGLPLDLEAAEADLRRVHQLAFELDHNGALDNSSGGQNGDHQPFLFSLRTGLDVTGPGDVHVGGHHQSVNQSGQAKLEPPSARMVLDQFGWYRANLSAVVGFDTGILSEDLWQQSMLPHLPDQLALESLLDFQVTRAVPVPTDEVALTGPWQAQDAKGVFGGSLDLRQVEGQVRGTYSSSFGVLPVTGSLVDGALHLVFHFGVGPLGRVLQDASLAEKVGPITAVADFQAAAGATTLPGTLIPFNIHYNADGVTEVYQGGRIDPKNLPRDFSLYRG